MYKFGQYPIRASEIFYFSRFSVRTQTNYLSRQLGLVNLKPIVPGHVLVLPRRPVERFSDMSPDEVSDLFLCAQQIGRVIEREFSAESLTLTIQDGKAAGQSVYHVHLHVIPRKKGDWLNNDDIYPEIDDAEKEIGKGLKRHLEGHEHHEHVNMGVDFEERPPRTQDEMAKESDWLRQFFPATNRSDNFETK